MSESVVATIEKVEPIKSGTSGTGKPWTLYRVTAGGQTYTTFEKDWQKSVGQERTIEYESVKNGAYLNKRIVDPKPQKRGDGRLAQRVEELHVKVDRLTEEIESLNAMLHKILSPSSTR